jgi:hypothetical protein
MIILFPFLQRVPPLRIDDLIDDLKDGTKLLALLEVLSGERLVSSKIMNQEVTINYNEAAERSPLGCPSLLPKVISFPLY